MRRPIPLFWGIVAFFLFIGFAVVTQLQFNRIANDKVYQARIESYENSLDLYDTAVEAYNTCVTAIETRDTYRSLFAGVESMFTRTANLPVALFPDSEYANAYREAMLNDIHNTVTATIQDNLPPRRLEDCPELPLEKPERPT